MFPVQVSRRALTVNNRFIRIVFVVLFVFGLTGRNHVFAETVGGKGHQHENMQYMPSMSEEETVASIKTEPEHITAGTPATIVSSIKDRQERPITDLTVHHDRLVHVVIASQDFSVFAHIHPEDFGSVTSEMKKTAQYPVKYTFPKAGRYIVGIDYAVKERPVSKHFSVHVAGGPEMGSPKKDMEREKRFGDLDVRFSPVQEHITAGKEVKLSYLFRKNGKAVTDLEPYLSAPMHLAIISGDLTRFMHTHGEIPGEAPMGHAEHMHMTVPKQFGPQIDVHVVFPAKGLYQIFGQVGYQGKVILTSFMVEVE